MSFGKFALFGLGGFFLIGLVASQFAPEMTPEQDLASGKRFFREQCSSLMQNRKINGGFGRYVRYCDCVTSSVDPYLQTGDEFRYAEGIHEAVGTERWLAEETRMKLAMERVMDRWENQLGKPRMFAISYNLIDQARTCARSM